MKKISKKALMTTIKKEYKKAHEFCKAGRGRSYAMMLDTDDAQIWSDVFWNKGDYKNYHSATIVRLDYEARMQWYTTPYIVEAYLGDAIEKLHNAGWTLVD